MREYEPIWLAIKTNGSVTIRVEHPFLAPRIKKAVKKEKWKDLELKSREEEYWRLKITYSKKTGIMHFQLVTTPGVGLV